MNYTTVSIKKYLKELSSSQPIPGGGSAAALVASVGVSLALMVARIMVKKRTTAQVRRDMRLIRILVALEGRLQAIIDADPKVYAKLCACYALPKTHPHRTMRIQKNLLASFCVMHRLCIEAIAAMNVVRQIASYAKGAIANDITISRLCLTAAARAAHATAALNANYITDQSKRQRLERMLRTVKVPR